MAFPNFSVTTNHVNGTTANATNVNGNFADVEDARFDFVIPQDTDIDDQRQSANATPATSGEF